MSMDAELWLYFDKQTKAGDLPFYLRLIHLETNLNFEVSNKCIHRTYLHSAFPDVIPWSATENISPDCDHLVAVSMRLRHSAKDFFRQSIKWTLTFETTIEDKVQSQESTFVTDQCSEEGLSTVSIAHDGDHSSAIFFRYLLIWDVLAPPAPGLQSSHKRSKSWLSDPKTPKPLLIGHRGMGARDRAGNPDEHPRDNTIVSFNEAFAVGADVVELDVQLSHDDALIVRHDFSVGDKSNKCFYRDLEALKIVKSDPDTPLLSDVFREVDSGLGINIEVKYPMYVMSGLLENEEEALTQMEVNGQKVLRWPKNKLAELVLKTVEPEAKKRRLFLSTFHPDLALLLSRKIAPSLRPLLPVMELTRGERHRDCTPEKRHLDLRCQTVAAAAAWSRAVDLDGVVPYAASAFAVENPAEMFPADDLAVVLWGWGLNSVAVLKEMQQQPWVFGLIFDNLSELLPQVRNAAKYCP